MLLIDIHVHCRAEQVAQEDCGFPTPQELLDCLDQDGIDQAMVMGVAGPELKNGVIPPADLLKICQASQGRLKAFLGIDPREHSPAEIPDYIRRWHAAGCVGIGEQIHNLPIDDPANDPIYETAAELGMPITFHFTPSIADGYGVLDGLGLPGLERVLQNHPDLIVLGHSQVFWAHIADDVKADTMTAYPKGPVAAGRVVELMRQYPNLHGDLSAGSGHNALVRDPAFGLQFIEEFQDRLHFATDRYSQALKAPLVPWIQQQQEQGSLSEAVIRKLAHENSQRLFNL